MKIHTKFMRILLFTIGGYEVQTDGDAFMFVFTSPLLTFTFGLECNQNYSTAPWPSDLLDLLQVEGGSEGIFHYGSAQILLLLEWIISVWM